jgi:hypothetical protein
MLYVRIIPVSRRVSGDSIPIDAEASGTAQRGQEVRVTGSALAGT